MAFKMKGSPMQRNFGIGASPMKDVTTWEKIKAGVNPHSTKGSPDDPDENFPNFEYPALHLQSLQITYLPYLHYP